MLIQRLATVLSGVAVIISTFAADEAVLINIAGANLPRDSEVLANGSGGGDPTISADIPCTGHCQDARQRAFDAHRDAWCLRDLYQEER
jgi:hypothetical protein